MLVDAHDDLKGDVDGQISPAGVMKAWQALFDCLLEGRFHPVLPDELEESSKMLASFCRWIFMQAAQAMMTGADPETVFALVAKESLDPERFPLFLTWNALECVTLAIMRTKPRTKSARRRRTGNIKALEDAYEYFAVHGTLPCGLMTSRSWLSLEISRRLLCTRTTEVAISDCHSEG